MSEIDNKVKMIVEGCLMAANRPLSLENISQVFSEEECPDRKELKAVMEAIVADCDDRGFELVEVASGYRFQVKQELGDWVAKLWEEKPPRYTRALLETLALIAYRQPITRGDIEEIRGVGVSSNIIRTLIDREWVRVVGHRDVPGRPAMFATTKQFLDYFNLQSLQGLPPLSEIKELDKTEQELDLGDELAAQRVIDLPEDVSDENSVELSDSEKAEMLAEEEAIELSKKPLDEILNLGEEVPDDSDQSAADEDADSPDEPDSLAEEELHLAEVIPLKRPGLETQMTGAGESDHTASAEEPDGKLEAFLPEDEEALSADFADQASDDESDRIDDIEADPVEHEDAPELEDEQDAERRD